MLAVTVKKITARVYRTWEDLAKPLGREHFTHSEGIQLFRKYFGPNGIPVAAMLMTRVASVLPSDLRNAASLANPAQLDELMARMDTEEKFEAWLLSEPEPSPEQREAILNFVDSLLPSVGKLLMAQSKQFPHKRGGRRKEFSAEEASAIRKEIKRRRGPEVKLDDIFTDLARSHDVSKTTIKRVWLDGKSDPPPPKDCGDNTVK